MSMKFTPTYSFFTSTSPSFRSGTGRSVFHFSTSGPPLASITTPDMVLGMGAMVCLLASSR